jgi:Rieske Fe-S protein
VNFRKELGIIECPCHQSRFSPEGTRQAGPARKNLAIFPVRVLKDDQGTITGYEVTL